MKKTIKHYTESILYDIEQAARIARFAAVQTFENLNCDLLPDEYTALDVISCKNEICQRDLAKIILKDRANTGRILNSLENKGFIKRFADTKNNRLVKKMALTDIGIKKLNEVSIKLEQYTQTMTDKFAMNEIENLQLALRQFRSNVEKALELNI